MIANINELIEIINQISEKNTGTFLYAYKKDNTIKQIILTPETSKELLKRYIDFLKNEISNETPLVEYQEYSEREKQYYRITLDSKLDEKMIKVSSITKKLTNSYEEFTIDESKDLEGLVVYMETDLQVFSIYIPYFHLYTVNRKNFYLIRKEKSFSSLSLTDSLTFIDKVYFCYYREKKNNKDILIWLELGKIEKENWLNQQVESKIQELHQFPFIWGVEKFKEHILKERKLREKFLKLDFSSDLTQKITTEKIKNFLSKNINLKDKILFDENNWKLKITSKEKVLIVLNLLWDDYLKSNLTELEYESEKKKTVIFEENIKDN